MTMPIVPKTEAELGQEITRLNFQLNHLNKEITKRDILLARASGLGPDTPPEIAAKITEAGVDEWVRLCGRQWAREKLNGEQFQPPGWDEVPGTLADSLARPRPPVRYLVGGLLGARHNLSVEGLFKAGKTALLAALCGSLADGRAFLGFAPVTRPAGRIGVWNLEMDAEDFDEYLAAEVEDTTRVWVAHLRSRPVPLLDSHASRSHIIKWLKAGQCSVWLIDTWSKLCAWNGIDPLDNAGVARLTAAIDEVKGEAGVGCCVVSTHMPHSAKTDRDNERAFGAQSFSGWVDGMWRYTRDDAGMRFLSADGRKIGLPECQVYQGAGGQLQAVAGDRQAAKAQTAVYAVLTYVRENPGSTTNGVRAGIGGKAETVSQALQEAAKQGVIYSQNGQNRAKQWFPVSPNGPGFTQG